MQPRLGNTSSSLLARNGNGKRRLAQERDRDAIGIQRGFFAKCADPILERSEFDPEPKNSKSRYLFCISIQESENIREAEDELPRIRAADKNIQDR